jgi:hypothetical protein
VSVILGALVLAGCGLVSGLDSLSVEGGAPLRDAAADVTADAGTDVTQDVIAPPEAAPGDGGTTSDARAGTALLTKGGCASAGGATTLSLTNDNFTIELWLRLDVAALGTETDPVLWKGGRSASEPGWSLVVQAGNLLFCVSDTSGSKCTTPYALTAGHLVHIGVKSSYTANTPLSRVVNVYARDVTASELSHTNVGSLTGAANNWTSTAPFTIGGAIANACTNTPAFTIDDVRIYSSLLSLASMDNSESIDVACNTLGLLAYYKFNEGSGLVANDCSGSAFNLTLGQNQSFVPSPFP